MYFLYKIVEENIFNQGEIKLKDITIKDLQNYQNQYLEYIKKHSSKKKFFVDKALLNFKWIGLIVNIFPNCKIIN